MKGTDIMSNSILWSRNFIPIYFIVGILGFWLFNNYIKANTLFTILLILPVIGVGFTSIIYNYKIE